MTLLLVLLLLLLLVVPVQKKAVNSVQDSMKCTYLFVTHVDDIMACVSIR